MAKKINHEAVSREEELVKLFMAINTELGLIRTLINELRTDLSEHTHGGVTAGAGTTSAGAAIAAAAVVSQVESPK